MATVTRALDKVSSSYKGRGRNTRGFLCSITNKDELKYYEFQFNPSELGGGDKSNWELFHIPGSVLPVCSFLQTEPNEIAFDLLVDATDKTTAYGTPRRDYRQPEGNEFIGVYADIMAISSLGQPNIDPSINDVLADRTVRFTSPAYIILGMGPLIKRCILQGISWKILQWFNNLTPSRAVITINLMPISSGLETDLTLVKENITTTNLLFNKIYSNKIKIFINKKTTQKLFLLE